MDQSAFEKLFKTNVPHILEKIFFSLDYESYKSCHEVCKNWSKLLSTEHLTKKADKMLAENNEMLRSASKEGNTDEVRRILSKGMVDVNCDFEDYWSSMLVAVVQGHIEVLKLLLNAGGNPNQEGRYGYTPLHCAASSNRKDIVQLLLENGAEPDKQDRSWLSPLHMAAMCGRHNDVDVVKLLIESGADIHVADVNGQTPLHIAAWMGQKEMAQALLDAGADPSKKDDKGQTPLSYARSIFTIGYSALKNELVDMLTDAKSRQ